jgi:hypothetical protein
VEEYAPRLIQSSPERALRNSRWSPKPPGRHRGTRAIHEALYAGPRAPPEGVGGAGPVFCAPRALPDRDQG